MSLRDVERAMIIFRFFCDKGDKFHELVSEIAEEEVNDVNLFRFHLIYFLNFIRKKNLLIFSQEP